MAFEHYDNIAEISPKAECRPDFEAKAAMLKKKLYNVELMQDVTKQLIADGYGYQFRHINSLAELLGGLEIIKDQINKDYGHTLKLIEREN